MTSEQPTASQDLLRKLPIPNEQEQFFYWDFHYVKLFDECI